MITLVLLVVLSTLAYTLSRSIASQRHRNEYIINYQAARYGCDSAVKYTLAMIADTNTPKLIERPNEPDFSDLFAMSEIEYQEFLEEWAIEKALYQDQEPNENKKPSEFFKTDEPLVFNEFHDVNEPNDTNSLVRFVDYNDANTISVPGPYGPPWPFTTKPVEIMIGPAKVRIQIEDENAKYPLGWALLQDDQIQREAQAGFMTFCEWMGMDPLLVDQLNSQLEQIAELKTFKSEFKSFTKRKIITSTPKQSGSKRNTRRRRTRRPRKPKFKKTTIPASVHSTDFAKFFHSSILDTEALAEPTIISESRKESALKYLGTWASGKVNINTAPRHVLESAFVFGGDAEEIAEEIIQRRRIKPFKDIEELKRTLLSYSESIRKCEKYIITASNFFTIKITATSGSAQVSAVIAVRKEGKNVERIALITG